MKVIDVGIILDKVLEEGNTSTRSITVGSLTSVGTISFDLDSGANSFSVLDIDSNKVLDIAGTLDTNNLVLGLGDLDGAGGGSKIIVNSGATKVELHKKVLLSDYGSGTYTGTVAKNLSVDSSGNIIEVDPISSPIDGSGTENYISKWDDANTLTDSVMYEDSSKIGIGITDPTQELEVSGDIQIRNANGNNPTDAGALYFREAGAVWGTSMYGFRFIHNGSTNKLNLQSSNLTTTKELMSIDRDSGNVGIGTVTPSTLLEVNGGRILVVDGTSGYIHAGNTNNFFYGDTNNNVIIQGTNSIRFWQGASEISRFDSSGRLGIGTSSPNHALDVYSNENIPLRIHRPNNANLNSTGSYGIGFSTRGDATTSTSDTRAGIFSFYNGGLFLATDNSNVYTDPASKARLTILNGGNVGIGTISPSETLEVVGNIRLGNGATRDIIGPTNESLRILANPNSTTEGIIFSTDGGTTTEMFIQDGGNVGIGTTTPDTLLNIESTKNNAILTLGSTTNDSSWSLGDKIGGINFYSADVSGGGAGVKASISYELSNGNTGATNAMVFRAAGASSGTNDTERMRISSTGQIILNDYGSGTHTGTAAKGLAVDISGNVIETTITSTPNLQAVTTAGSSSTDDIWVNSVYLDGNEIWFDLGENGLPLVFKNDVFGSPDELMRLSPGNDHKLSINTTDTTAVLSIKGPGTGDSILVKNKANDTNIFKVTRDGVLQPLYSSSLVDDSTTIVITDNNYSSIIPTSSVVIGAKATNGSTTLDEEGRFVAIGYEAGANLTGQYGLQETVAVGYQAGYGVDSRYSTYVGHQAGLESSGSSRFDENTFIGRHAGIQSVGGWNTYIGDEAGDNAWGNNNVSVGGNSFYQVGGSEVNNAYGNTVIGYNALGVANIGGWDSTARQPMDNNIVIGHGTAARITMSHGNTIIGAAIMQGDQNNYSNTIVLGSYNKERLYIFDDGQYRFEDYGVGSFTGTAAYNLSVDDSGNVIETTIASTPTLQSVTDENNNLTTQITTSAAIKTSAFPAVYSDGNYNVTSETYGSHTASFSGFHGIEFQHNSNVRFKDFSGATKALINTGGDYRTVGDVTIGNLNNPLAQLHVEATNGNVGQILVKGGNNTVTANGEINSELLFGSNDTSVSNTVGGKISSVTEATNGSRTGLAFYTYNQSVSPDLDEHMRLDYLGNVGIGTTSPTGRLNISSSAASTYLLNLDYADGTDGGGFYEAASTGLNLFLKNSSGTNKVTIAPAGDSFFTGGRVGIGTTATSFSVGADNLILGAGSGDSGMTIYSATANNGSIYFADSTGTGVGNREGQIIYSHSGNSMTFATNHANHMVIGSDGVIKFNTYGSGTHTGTLAKTLGVDSSGNIIEVDAASGGVDGLGTVNYVPKWSATDTLTDSVIYDDGTNVGIGTATPSYTLEVDGGSDNTIASFVSTDAGSFISFADDSTTSGEYVQIGAVGNELAIRTNNASVVRIDDSGNVGIGTDSPTSLLHISGSGNTDSTTSLLVENSDGDDLLRIYDDGSKTRKGKITNSEIIDFYLPTAGTKAVIATVDDVTFGEIHFLSTENGYIQPFVLEIVKEKTSDVPILTRKDNYNHHSHSNDVIFSADASGNIYAEKALTTARYLRFHKVEIFKGNITIEDGTTTTTGGGSDQTRTPFVGGSGTANYISKWSDSDTLTDSLIYDDGVDGVGIGTTSVTANSQLTIKSTQVVDQRTIFDIIDGNNDSLLKVGALGYFDFDATNGASQFFFDSKLNQYLTPSGPELFTQEDGNIKLNSRTGTSGAYTTRLRVSGSGDVVIPGLGGGGVGTAPTNYLGVDNDGKLIKASTPTGTLNEVLTAGNESSLDAYIGDLYVEGGVFHKDDVDTNISFASNNIRFSANSTEVMRVTGGGLAVGDTSGAGKLHVKADELDGSTYAFWIENSSNQYRMFVMDDGTTEFRYSSSVSTMNLNGIPNTLVGNYSVLLGTQAGRNNASEVTNPDDNKTLVGYQAGAYATSSADSVMVGYESGLYSSGSENTYIGNEVAQYSKGNESVVIGSGALKRTSRSTNNISKVVAIGNGVAVNRDTDFQANSVLIGYEAAASTTASIANSVMVGYKAGEEGDTLGGSTIIGYHAGRYNKGGTEDNLGVYVGQDAGSLTTENDGERWGNIFMGYRAGFGTYSSSKYNTIIGHKAGYNSKRIGDGNTLIGSNIYEEETTLPSNGDDGTFIDTLIIGAGRQPRLQVSSSGKFQLHDYGEGTFDETTEATTLTKQLGVDASGHVIETGVTYMGSSSVTFNSGVGTFTVSPVPTHMVLTLQTTTPGEILTYNGVSGAGLVTVNLKTDGGTLVSGDRTVHYMYKV